MDSGLSRKRCLPNREGHAINLCRFEIGELDEWVPGLRLADDASFFDLPPWKPEVRVPERIAPLRAGS